MNIDQNAFRILIVDDVPKNIQVLGSILLKESYNITFAHNGLEALSIAKSNELDLILLDVMMPGIDGFETCSRLKEDEKTKDIPVIFMTALTETTDKVRGFHTGAVDYITKPYESEEVLARVKTHLTIRKLQKDLALKINDLEIRNEFIKRIFGSYISDDVVNNLLESPEGVKMGGEKRIITMLLSDLRGFSSISEGLSPEETVTLLNNYFRTMTDVILKYGGIIDEFIGDAILVLFGAPIWKEDHVERAAACALEMQLAMVKINELNRKGNLPELQMGIGINTGEVVVGNIGSVKRIKYGVVGRHVNIVSRIESYTVGNQILVSENTFKALQPILKIRKTIKVNPKGVKEPISLYDIVGIEGSYNISLKEEAENLLSLKNAIPVKYTVLDEKSADQLALNGELKKLSLHKAILETDTDIPLYSNLKLEIYKNGGSAIPGDVYAKVLDNLEVERGCYEIHFTLQSNEVKDYLKIFREDNIK